MTWRARCGALLCAGGALWFPAESPQAVAFTVGLLVILALAPLTFGEPKL